MENNFIKHKTQRDRVNLDRVISYGKGTHHYMTGVLGLGKPGFNYTIIFYYDNADISWSFKDGIERDRVFEEVETRFNPTEI